jgi:hypothetical protein
MSVTYVPTFVLRLSIPASTRPVAEFRLLSLPLQSDPKQVAQLDAPCAAKRSYQKIVRHFFPPFRPLGQSPSAIHHIEYLMQVNINKCLNNSRICGFGSIRRQCRLGFGALNGLLPPLDVDADCKNCEAPDCPCEDIPTKSVQHSWVFQARIRVATEDR